MSKPQSLPANILSISRYLLQLCQIEYSHVYRINTRVKSRVELESKTCGIVWASKKYSGGLPPSVREKQRFTLLREDVGLKAW